MIRVRLSLFAAALVGFAATLSSAQAQQGSTIKGQVVFPADKAIPARAAVNVTQDKPHCLSKGDILTEDVIVNPKTRGISNVVVWLRPDDPNPRAPFPKDKIDPSDATRKAEDVVLDQPCCMFIPRVKTARVGDTILVKNSAPVAHNFFWTSANNGELNVTVPSNGQHKFAMPLVAENTPIGYKCTIHPWMNGWVRVFDHPYYAVTDADGKFEIKNAPPGKWKMVVWHEAKGFLGGAPGRFGQEVNVAGATTEMKPIDFDVTPTP